jgi:hypothetical protein
MELILVGVEVPVGRYYADIVCRDATTDQVVVIENQLAPTDHSHLGQLLTYAGGLNASVAVWIADGFTDEHREAIDSVNQRTGERLTIFGLELELLRFGEVLYPRFLLCARRAARVRAARRAASKETEMTDDRQIQLDFWDGFKNYMAGSRPAVQFLKMPEPHYVIHLRPTGSSFIASVARQKPEYHLAVELLINGHDGHRKAEVLLGQAAVIRAELGFDIEMFESRPGRVGIRWYVDYTKAPRDECFEWLSAHLVPMLRVLPDRVGNL